MTSSPSILQLDDVLDLPAAAPLAAQLAKRRGQPLTLDASKVRRLGGLCLQVLLAARAEREAADDRLDVATPSEAFTLALAHFGVPTLATGFRSHRP